MNRTFEGDGPDAGGYAVVEGGVVEYERPIDRRSLPFIAVRAEGRSRRSCDDGRGEISPILSRNLTHAGDPKMEGPAKAGKSGNGKRCHESYLRGYLSNSLVIQSVSALCHECPFIHFHNDLTCRKKFNHILHDVLPERRPNHLSCAFGLLTV